MQQLNVAEPMRALQLPSEKPAAPTLAMVLGRSTMHAGATKCTLTDVLLCYLWFQKPLLVLSGLYALYAAALALVVAPLVLRSPI